MNHITKHALTHAILTALYVALVVSAIFYAPKFVPGADGGKTILIPIGMLLLFVTSAAITSSLVFGRPLLWYLDGKKKEAVMLAVQTIGTLFVIMLLMFLAVVATQ